MQVFIMGSCPPTSRCSSTGIDFSHSALQNWIHDEVLAQISVWMKKQKKGTISRGVVKEKAKADCSREERAEV
ncbi:hypothetical protein LINPERHAP1_LOCUS21015 [Linum perenne]